MLYKDTEEGKKFKKEMDKNYHRQEVTKEKLRELLGSLKFSELLDLCFDSDDELIEHFLSKNDNEIDDALFTFLHRYRKFAFKLKGA